MCILIHDCIRQSTIFIFISFWYRFRLVSLDKVLRVLYDFFTSPISNALTLQIPDLLAYRLEHEHHFKSDIKTDYMQWILENNCRWIWKALLPFFKESLTITSPPFCPLHLPLLLHLPSSCSSSCSLPRGKNFQGADINLG